MLAIAVSAFAAKKNYFYQQQKLLIDNDLIYSYGRKNINNSNKNINADGFEHNGDFCVVRYNAAGKKQREVVIDKDRDFIKNSKLIKRGNSFYVILEYMTRNVNKHIFYNTVYLTQLDSTANITSEKIILDSSFYGFNHVFYTQDYIYITLRATELVCLKYDYNFNIIDSITDPLTLNLFFNSRDDIETNSGIVNIGPNTDIELINDQTKNKTRIPYEPNEPQFIKRLNMKQGKKAKIDLIPLPDSKSTKMFAQEDKIYFLITDKIAEKDSKLYLYEEGKNALKLITDTLGKNSSLAYFNELGDNEFIMYNWGNGYKDVNRYSWYPDELYYIKGGKVIQNTSLNKEGDEYFLSDFRVLQNKLYIYTTNTFGGDIIVNEWDYITGTIKKL
jgi:hypothetical protein